MLGDGGLARAVKPSQREARTFFGLSFQLGEEAALVASRYIKGRLHARARCHVEQLDDC